MVAVALFISVLTVRACANKLHSNGPYGFIPEGGAERNAKNWETLAGRVLPRDVKDGKVQLARGSRSAEVPLSPIDDEWDASSQGDVLAVPFDDEEESDATATQSVSAVEDLSGDAEAADMKRQRLLEMQKQRGRMENAVLEQQATIELQKAQTGSVQRQAQRVESKLASESAARQHAEARAAALEGTTQQLQSTLASLSKSISGLQSEQQVAHIQRMEASRRAMRAEALQSGEMHAFVDQALQGVSMTNIMRTLETLGSAVKNREMMSAISQANAKVRGMAASQMHEQQERVAELVAESDTSSMDQFMLKVGVFFNTSAGAIAAHVRDILEVAESVRKSMPEGLIESIEPFAKKLVPRQEFLLEVDSKTLAHATVSSFCVSAARAMRNATAALNVSSQLSLLNATKKMLPMLGGVMPDLNPEVYSFIRTMVSFAEVEALLMNDASAGIVDDVGALLKTKLHCNWETTPASFFPRGLKTRKHGDSKRVDAHQGQKWGSPRFRPMAHA